MKAKELIIFKVISALSLLISVAMAVWAFFKMDKTFQDLKITYDNVDFQIFVWIIILSATTSFFISWRMFLKMDSINAENSSDITEEDLLRDLSITKKNNYEVNWSKIFEELPSDKFPTVNLTTSLQNICRNLDIDLAMSFIKNEFREYEIKDNYAVFLHEKIENFTDGDGLSGQVAMNKIPLHLKEIPENYVKIISGSGYILPKNLYIIPLVHNDESKIIFEFADMKSTQDNSFELLKQFVEELSNRIF
jgi:hypothetical protein